MKTRVAKTNRMKRGIRVLFILMLMAMVATGFSISGGLQASAAENHQATTNIKLPTGGVEEPEIEVKGEIKKESSGKRSAGLKASSSTSNPCTTLTAAGKELAAKLAKRESKPVIVCSEDFGCRNVMNEALKHIKVANKGDYIRWTQGGWSASWTISNVCTYTFDKSGKYNYYTSLSQEKTMNTKVPQTLSSLGISSKSTDYDKLCAIYDWICTNIKYDYTNLDDDSYKLKYTAYAAMVNKTAVCQGYANLLYRMLLEAGVDCRIITGGNHAWNIVKINGKWYNVDSTWDATYKQAGQSYRWFLKSASSFASDHTRSSDYTTSEFESAYPTSTSNWSSSNSKGCAHNYSLKETKTGCDEFGYKVYRCGKCTNEYQTNFTDPAGHSYSRYVYKNANQHAKVCSGCDEEEGLYAHIWNSGLVTRQPTATQTGIRTYTCTACSGTKTEEIPRLINYRTVSFGTTKYQDTRTLSSEDKDGTGQENKNARGYKYTGQSGERIKIKVDSQMDTMIFLLDSSGNQISRIDDYGSGSAETCQYTFPSSGDVYIQVANYSSSASGSYTIQIERPVQSISLNKTSAIIGEGGSVELSATINPSNTTDTGSVTWSSSDTSVATVDSNGRVSAVDGGTATITARFGDKTATCQVTVKALTYQTVSSLKFQQTRTLSEESTTGYSVNGKPAVGYRYYATAGERIRIDMKSTAFDTYLYLLDANKNQLDNNDDGGEDRNARITYDIETSGYVYIQATAYSGTSTYGEFTLEISRPLKSISLNKTRMDMSVGDQQQLNVEFAPANTTDSKQITWSSSDSSVAQVGLDGRVTAQRVGTAEITAAVGSKQVICTVNVTQLTYRDITLGSSKYTDSRRLSQTDKDGTGQDSKPVRGYRYYASRGETIKVDMESSDFDTYLYLLDSSKQRIDKNDDGGSGHNAQLRFTAESSGYYYIQAAGYSDTDDGEYTLTVSRPITNISISTRQMEMWEGQQRTLDVTIAPENTTDSRDITWTSSDRSVATVDEEGKVTAKNSGNVTITAQTPGGQSVECQVTVRGISYRHVGALKYTDSGNLSSSDNDGLIGEGKYIKAYRYYGQEGEKIRIDMHSNDFDSYLYVLDANKQIIDTDDDGGRGDDARINYEFTTSGYIYIRAGSYRANPSGSYEFTISRPLRGIAFDRSRVTVQEGDTTTINAGLIPANTTDTAKIYWSSNDNEIATINTRGELKGKSVGTVIVTATAGGFETECEVTVTARKPAGNTGNSSTGSGSGSGSGNGGTGSGSGSGNGGSGSGSGSGKPTGGKPAGGNSSKGNPAAGTGNGNGSGTGAGTGSGSGASANSTGSGANLNKTIKVDRSIPRIANSSINTVANVRGKKMTILVTKGTAGADNYMVAYRVKKNAGTSAWNAGTKNAGAWKYSLTGGKKKYVVKGMKKNALLQFKVATVKNGKRSAWSKTNCRWFQQTKARAKAGKKSFVLKMKKVQGASGYIAYYSAGKNLAGNKVKISRGAGNTRIKAGNLKAGTTYYIKYRPYKTYKGVRYYGILKTVKCRAK